jgi:pyruvate formate lyase activating enzyme
MSVDDLVQQLLRDEPFFRRSSGGVTLSGGECTMTPAYVSRVAQALKEAGVHVVLETCGHFEFIPFETKVLPFLDWIYFDLKLAEPTEHLRHLGVDNELILKNFEKLCRLCPKKVHPRIPIVPGVSDSRENLEQLAQLIARHRPCPPTLLPYHSLGHVMYTALGRPLPDGPTRGVTAEEMHRAQTYFEAAFNVAVA